MALRLHSRLVLWNLFLVSLASFILSFFLTASQLALMIVVAVAAAFIFTYGVHVLVLRPLHRVSLVWRTLLKPSFSGSLLRLWRSPLERTEFCKPMSHP